MIERKEKEITIVEIKVTPAEVKSIVLNFLKFQGHIDKYGIILKEDLTTGGYYFCTYVPEEKDE